MKTAFHRFVFPVALLSAALSGEAQTFTITNNASAAGLASYDFGPATVSTFFGDTELTPNAVINSGNLVYLGVNSTPVLAGDNNVNAINDRDGVFGGADQERLRLSLDTGFSLSEFTWQWSRADGPLATDGVSISGFLSDPGATFSGGTSGTPFYTAGVLNFQITAFNGTIQTVYLANPTASYDATLEFIVADSTQGGAQLALRTLTLVPEPTTATLLGFGILGVFMARRLRD